MDKAALLDIDMKRTAVHEAAHAVAHYLLDGREVTATIYENPTIDENEHLVLGFCRAPIVSDARKRAVIALAGEVASLRLQEPDADCWDIEQSLSDIWYFGDASASDVEMAGPDWEQHCEETVRFVDQHWDAICQAASEMERSLNNKEYLHTHPEAGLISAGCVTLGA